MGIEIIHGSRPGDNAIGKRIDSIVAQQENEKQRALQASLEAARINASMSAQRSELALRNKSLDVNAQLDMQRMALAAQQQEQQNFMQGLGLGVRAREGNQQLVMEGVRSGMIPREMGAAMLYGPEAGRYAAAAFAQEDQGQQLAQQLNMRQAAASQAQLNPEGQNLYRSWASNLAAVIKNQDSLRPQALNQARQRLIDDFDKLDLRRFQVKIPTIDEDWQNNAKQLDDGTWVVREMTKSGATWRQIGSPKSGKAGQNAPMSMDPDMQIRTVLQDRDTYNKEMGAATKRLDARREQMQKDAMILEQKKLDAEYDRKYAGKPDAPERPKASLPILPPPTDEEVMNEMYRHLRGWHQSVTGGAPQGQPQSQGLPPGGPPPAGMAPPQAPQGGPNSAGIPPQQPLVDTLSANGQQGSMPPSASVRVTKQMRDQVEQSNPVFAQLRKVGDPEVNAALNVLTGVQAAIATGQMRPDDPTANAAVQKAQAVIQERTAKIEADRRASQAIKTIGKEKVEAAMPSVKNAKDYSEIPSGTAYRDPTGKVRIKP